MSSLTWSSSYCELSRFMTDESIYERLYDLKLPEDVLRHERFPMESFIHIGHAYRLDLNVEAGNVCLAEVEKKTPKKQQQQQQQGTRSPLNPNAHEFTPKELKQRECKLRAEAEDFVPRNNNCGGGQSKPKNPKYNIAGMHSCLRSVLPSPT